MNEMKTMENERMKNGKLASERLRIYHDDLL